MTFSRHCSCLRTLEKQVTNIGHSKVETTRKLKKMLLLSLSSVSSADWALRNEFRKPTPLPLLVELEPAESRCN